ncbi:MAG: tetratricopeptide repeat protein [Calditrichaeota bacterium]|nr:tetratricopeptide repeat protein [Calditrichota bacterium]
MLKPSKRITKAQLKEDQFLLATARIEKWFETNRRTVLYALVGLLVLGGGLAAYTWSRASAQKDAAFAEMQARDAFSRADFDSAMILAEGVIENFEGTKAAASAWMLKGKIHEQRSEFVEAAKAFERITHKYAGEEYLAFGAHYALGSMDFGNREFEKAARHFDLAARNFPKHFNAPVALVKGGEALERLQKYDQARGFYQRVVSKYPKSRAADGARESLAKIEFMK